MPSGIIVIDKPMDWTSHDVVAKLRGILRERRVGHAGTLDPMATGILPVFVGRATRAVQFVMDAEKEYLAGLRLGLVTDTQDTSGTVLQSRPVSSARADLAALLPRFTGPILQVPPMYSALKRDGKKLYELARQGREVARDPRPITIHTLELVGQSGPHDYLLRVVCSKGTYVRTLCHDIGAALGCGGAMYSLRRTRAAGFTQGVTMEQVARAAQAGEAEALLLPVETCFLSHPAVTVGARERSYLLNGAPFPWPGPDGLCRVYGPEGDFLMLGRLTQGTMVTVKSFFAPDLNA